MYTIKVSSPSEGYRVLPVHGEVLVLTERDMEYRSRAKDMEEHWVRIHGGDRPMEHPKAILDFAEPGTENGREVYIYGDERAWIMNANGKTVASI